MSDNFVSATTPQQTMPAPAWSLYGDGHVLAGTIVVLGDVHIEAQILLDGQPLYRSRHTSRAVAEEELLALRGQWATAGWADAN